MLKKQGGKGPQFLRQISFANVVLGGEAWMLPMSNRALSLQVRDLSIT